MTKKKKNVEYRLLENVDERLTNVFRGTALGEDLIAPDLEDEVSDNGTLTFEQQLDLAIDKTHGAVEVGLDILRELKALKPQPKSKKLKPYTVIGIYADNNQRWAETFMADDTDHAEEQAKDSAQSSGSELIIAGVVDGVVEMQA